MIVYAHQNETVDALVFRVTGRTDTVEEVYRLNPIITKSSVFLPHGTPIVLPKIPENKTKTVKRISLWS